MYKHINPTDADIQRRNDVEAFRLVRKAIAELATHHYAELRWQLRFNATLDDWKRLVEK